MARTGSREQSFLQEKKVNRTQLGEQMTEGDVTEACKIMNGMEKNGEVITHCFS